MGHEPEEHAFILINEQRYTGDVQTVQRALVLIALNVALTCGISPFIGPKLPSIRRFCTSYLALVGVIYLVPGILGFITNAGIIEDQMWSLLISPYLTFIVFATGKDITRYPLHSIPSFFAPEGPHQLSSGVIIAVSLVGILAAFFMGRSFRAGLYIWIGLIILSFVLLSGYIYLGFLAWGISGIAGQLSWEASFLIAFIFATRGVTWRGASESNDARLARM